MEKEEGRPDELVQDRVASQAEKLAGKKAGLSEQKRAALEKLLKRRPAAAAGPATGGIPRRPDPAAPARLSFAQERLWLLEQLEAAYNIASALRMTGRLDLDAARRSLSEVVRRHEILRVRFLSLDGEPRQLFDLPADLPIPVLDLRALPAAAREAEALRQIQDEVVRPFDLARGPMVRAAMMRIDQDDWIALVDLHHIVSDGISAGLFMREFGALYSSLVAGARSPLPELPVQYADFAEWQRGWLTGAELEGQIAYWRSELAGSPALLELPTDRPRPAVQGARGGSATLFLPGSALDGLRALAEREGATLFMLVTAAFAALLHRWSGQDDIPLGTPISGRGRPEIEGLIGLFVNTLVLRVRLQEGRAESFRSLVGRVRRVALGAYSHQDLPFEKLVEELRVERSLGHNPLFQVMCSVVPSPASRTELAGLVMSPIAFELPTAKFDLHLIAAEHQDSLEMNLGFRFDLYERPTVVRLLRGFQVLLEAVAADPERRAADLPLLTAPERHQLLTDWNDTAAAYPDDLCLHEMVEAQAARTPGGVALVDGDLRWTYAELNARANRLARYLRALGAGPERPVGVLLRRSAEMIAALLAVLKSGGVYLPLDPAYPEERLALMMADARAPLLVTARALLDGFPALAASGARPVCLPDDLPEDLPEADLDRAALPENLAYLIYTSGSTGRPKGVAIEHRSAAVLLHWARETFPAEALSGMLAATSISFDLSVYEIFAPLAWGGRLILAENALALAGLPAAGEVKLINTVPSAMSELVRMGAVPPSARVVNLAGEALRRELVDRIYAAGVGEVFNLYGPSEDTTYSTWARIARDGGAPPPIGRFLPGTYGLVLDRQGHPAPLGAPGELCLGGAGLARGYLGRPELTAERFVPDPGGAWGGAPGARVYRTGDLVRWLPDGSLDYLGRIDHQVKVRGFRIELGEIEARLARHPAVREAAVLALGEGVDRRLAAYLVTPEPKPPVQDLAAHLRGTLPEYMVPAAWVFLDALPLSPNGKVDRRALARLDAAAGAGAGYVPPATPAEELIAGVWADLLKRERVGAHDDFFELGGHSLLATRVLSRIGETLGVELPLRRIFERPTVAGLARLVDEARAAGGGRMAPPLLPVPRGVPPPLSFAQERLWFLDRFEPGSPAYNMPSALRLSGRLDAAALAASVREIVRRHEVLRTTFPEIGGEPRQAIHPEPRIDVDVLDLRGLSEREREAAAARRAREEALTPFDLAQGPLIRARLLRLAEEEWLALFNLHHIVGDGWSFGVIVAELAALYPAFSEGRPSPLPELPVQYADFAVWQREWLRGAVLEAQISWWREELAGAPAVLELPLDRPRPAVPALRGASVDARLPEGLPAALAKLSRTQGTTLFMTLLAAFQALLYRLSGQGDVVVGSPVAGRTRPELEGLIGFFVNTLALRGRTQGDPTFLELLARVRRSALGAYAHQDLPFERLVEELRVERGLGHNPVFQVMFALQNLDAAPLELPGVTLAPLASETATSKFDLELTLAEDEAGIGGALSYSEDLFDRTTARRLLGQLGALLAAAAEDPGRNLSALPLLTEAERHQLVEWNDTRAAEGVALPVHRRFERQAERTPDATAARFAGGELTYAELDERAGRLAARLRELGVGPEVRVGLFVERSLDLPVAILGIWKAGGAYVPLDPAYPAERLAFMLEDSRAPVVVTQTSLHGHLSELSPGGARAVFADELPPVPAEPVESRPSDLAYLIYTSGTTGRPKAVMVEHGHLAHTLAACREAFDFRPGDRVPCIAPFSFDIFLFELLNPLLAGGAVEIFGLRPALDLEGLVASLEDATHFHAVPALMRQVVDTVRRDRRPERCARLRELFVGGDAVPGELLADMAAVFPAARTFVLYGPTEGTIICSRHAVQPGDSRPLLGRPLRNVELRLADATGGEVPVGVGGELWIGGPGVTRGYLHQPDLTAEKFLCRENGRWYRTGDLARRLADGTYEFLGRIDQQVKVRGFRIELGEIEARLARHPAVREAVVLAPGTGSDRRLVAYVVGEAGEREGLRAGLAASVPDYMVPTGWVFLDAFPLSPNGKVDRRALARIEPEAVSTAAYVAPRTPVEQLLAGIWSDLLGAGTVGARDDFFALGGHSLMAARLVSRLRDALGVELPLRALFEAPTLEGLAGRVEAARREAAGFAAPPLRPYERGPEAPLSFAQERLWFLDRLEPGSSAYNMPSAVRLTGALDVERMEACFREIARRHDTLRTRFAEGPQGPVQIVAPETDLRIEVRDLRGLPETGREDEARRLAGEEARRPFDIGRGPLLRVLLLRLAEEDHVGVFTMHHIVSDGWSMGILVGELTALYGGGSLPEPPVQYADFSIWQREWLHGDALERQLAFWRGELAGAPTVLEIPADRPRPAVQSFRGAVEPVELPAELSAAVAALARREGATPFMTLLAAFQTLLHRYTGQPDVLVGSPVAGRNRTELEGLIGFFVNTLVLRGRFAASGRETCPDGESFRAVLGRTRAATLAAYAHQDLPFERLVEELGVERSLAHGPLFQVVFALQNAPAGALELPGLTLAPLGVGSDTAKFDLSLSLSEADGRFAGTAEYAADLFDAATIRRLGGHFETLLRGLVEDPGRPAGALPLLSEAEARQVLSEWNQTDAEAPAEPVHRLFELRAAERPDAPAVVWSGGGLTYGELDRRAGLLAGRLRSLGVGPETVVAIRIERSAELVLAALAVLKAGGAYLPIDPAHPVERLLYLLRDSGTRLLLTTGALDLPHLPAESLRVDESIEAAEPPAAAADAAEHLAYVIYTSGSTGLPKGTELRHAGLANLAAWHRRSFWLTAGDRTTLLAGVGFDASVWEMWPALTAGAALHVPPAEIVASPPDLAAWLAERRITVSFLPTPLAEAVLAETGGDLPLRVLLTGGDRLRRRPDRRTRFLLVNNYGPTESSVVTTAGLVSEAGDRLPPIGRPIDNTRVFLLDRALRPVPVGIAGELCIAGAGLARGYRFRPQLTAEKFVPNPQGEPGSRLYRTGDLARWLPGGDIEFLSRIDHQVKIRGFRVEPGEIEAVLARHPEVREAAVLAVGEEAARRLVAYVAGEADAETLRRYLGERLPAFMVPAAFVFLDALPLNASGKVDRGALARIAPEAEREAVSAPLRPAEELLAGIWSDLLGAPAVAAGDDFFALGGHSLLATRLISRLREVFGVELPLREVFQHSGLSALAGRVEALQRESAEAPAPPIVPLSPERRGARPPLSFAQERLWFLDRLDPGALLYSLPSALRASGELDPAALRAALDALARRHESLRTTFGERDGVPFQVVAAEPRVPLAVVDLAGLPEERRESEARRCLAGEAGRPFDLSQGPLMRVLLARLAPQDTAMLLNLHHIITDGWSMDVLVTELLELYEAATEGRPAALAPLPVQYPDFAIWQRNWLRGDVLERQVAFWKRALEGAPTVLELPTDRPRPAVQGFRGGTRPLAIPAADAERLRAVTRREGVTLFMAVLAGLQALLFRYTGQRDLLLGSPVANRNRAEVEGLIGFFVNTLVLRGRPRPELPFRELLAGARTMALEAYAHQDFPFERLVDELRIERSLSRSPLYQVVLALTSAASPPPPKSGLDLLPLAVESGTSKTDLLLSMADAGAGEIQGSVEYACDLFDPATADRFAGHLAVLLGGAAADPGRPLAELPLLADGERRQLLGDWNDTAVPEAAPEEGGRLHELFELRAREHPEAVAVSFGGRRLTYGELDARGEALAAELRALGVGPEVLAGICADEGIERVVAVLGVFKTGGGYLPLDPSLPRERLAWMLEDARVPVLLTQEHLLSALPETEARVLVLGSDQPAPSRPPTVERLGDGCNLAYVIFTSGSTGRPNGVLVEHRAAMNLIRHALRDFQATPGSRVLQSVSFSFDASVLETWMALSAGAELCVAAREERLSSEALAGRLRAEGITHAVLTPAVLAGLPPDLPLRVASVGGDNCPAELASRWAPPASRLDRLLNCYGPTEASIYASSHVCQGVYRREPPIGRPVANLRLYVLDRQGNPLPVGVPGELHIAGRGLARGYLNRPELTADRFVPDPFSGEEGGRMYRSGDLVRYLPDGEVEFLGRVDRQVKIRGLRIELGEIEAGLGAHPAVQECAVLARGDHGGKRLVAYVVRRDAARTRNAQDPAGLQSSLRSHLRERLPDYMVPASFLFLEAMPIAPTGKVDRAALLQLGGDEGAERQDRVEPRDALELRLARIWEEVLGVPRIGIRDDFFAAGGHSLLAVRLTARIEQELGRALPLTALFEGGTVEKMAALLREREGGPASALVPIQSGGSRAPFFCVHPAGGDVLGYAALARHLGPDQPFYGLQSPGLAGGETPGSLQEMAALYLREIRRAQPRGPYRIGGWSLGGLIAFEMARQLRRRGEEVALLAILDGAPEYRGEEESELRLLLDVVAYVENLWGRSLGVDPAEIEELESPARVAYVLERLRESDFLPPGAGEEQIRRVLGVYRANTRAASGFEPGPYPGRVTLFRTEGAAGEGAERRHDLGWGRISGEPVEVHLVPGGHLTFLAEPHVQELARRLRRSLEEACLPAEPRGSRGRIEAE